MRMKEIFWEGLCFFVQGRKGDTDTGSRIFFLKNSDMKEESYKRLK